jgi:hypothetical protein
MKSYVFKYNQTQQDRWNILDLEGRLLTEQIAVEQDQKPWKNFCAGKQE